MIFSTKAASFLSSIKTQTYDKKERECKGQNENSKRDKRDETIVK